MSTPLDDENICIIHGDFWSSNILFNTSTGEASLIDFQFCRYGQPAVDLAVLLCTSVSPDLRRGANLDQLLHNYTKAFQEHSESKYVMSIDKYTAALPHALLLIVLSYETWTTNFDSEILLNRFASVVDDLAEVHFKKETAQEASPYA